MFDTYKYKKKLYESLYIELYKKILQNIHHLYNEIFKNRLKYFK